MQVICEKCNRVYDDAARWTICPHSPLGGPIDDLCPRCDTLKSVHGPCRHQDGSTIPPEGIVSPFKSTGSFEGDSRLRAAMQEELEKTRAKGFIELPAGLAIEGKYGEITASRKSFHPGEPVFLFRATDVLSVQAIEYYALTCQKNGCTPSHVSAIRGHAERIKKWQADNPKLVKLPD